MPHIELPQALDAYFAFAEVEPTRNGRRFTISLPYFDGDRLDRLQWWYHLTPDQERRMGDAALTTLRAQATERFRRHIERWLQNMGKRLYGDEPIPRLGVVELAPTVPESSPAESSSAAVEAPPDLPTWHGEKVANG